MVRSWRPEVQGRRVGGGGAFGGCEGGSVLSLSPAAGGLLAILGGPRLVEASRGRLPSSSHNALPVYASGAKSPLFMSTLGPTLMTSF